MKKLASLLLIAALAGCSSFDADYASVAALKEGKEKPLAGPWIGRWQSTQGHGGGELRAIVTSDGKAGHMSANQSYTARFKAKWGPFTSEYTSAVAAQSDIKKIETSTFTIETNLGPMVGTYTMKGESTPTTFSGTYKADHDEGTIDLKRP